MNIGVLQSEAGRSAQALDNFQLAQQLFVDLKRLNSKNGAKLLANIAMAKSQDGSDGAEVVSAFASALRMFKQQGLLRSKEGVRLLIQAGKAKEEMGEFAEALEDYKAARATLEEAGPPSRWIDGVAMCCLMNPRISQCHQFDSKCNSNAGAIGSKMGIEMLEKMSDWLMVSHGFSWWSHPKKPPSVHLGNQLLTQKFRLKNSRCQLCCGCQVMFSLNWTTWRLRKPTWSWL